MKRTETYIPLDDLRIAFQPIFLLGKAIGVFPSLEIWNRSTIPQERFKWRWNMIFWILPALVVTFVVSTLLRGWIQVIVALKLVAASDVAITVGKPLLFLAILFCYAYFLLRRKSFEDLLHKWRFYSDQLFFKKLDKKLYLHSNLLAALIMLSAIGENLLFDVDCITAYELKLGNNLTMLEKYYRTVESTWNDTIPYNPVLTAIMFVCHKFSIYTWNITDVIVVVFCRALYYKFKSLNSLVEEMTNLDIAINIPKINMIMSNAADLPELKQNSGSPESPWTEVKKDFLILCKLVDEVNNFISPAIFVSFCINIFFICMQLHLWVIPSSKNRNSTTATFVYLCVSLFQFVLRILLVTYYASNVHTHAHGIVECLQKCPDTNYSFVIERIERLLLLKPVGIHGLGIIFITRKFVLSVISFMFTFEIVLLQASSQQNV